METTLWTVKDIAKYYRRSLRQAQRIVLFKEFPPPVRGDRRRWVAEQVKAFAEGRVLIQEKDANILRHTVPIGRRITRSRAA